MKRSISLCAAIVVLLSARQATADVQLPKVISDHMVLQRDRPLPIWGWASPGEEVRVKLDDSTAATKADAQGNWKLVLPAVKADGKSHRMIVSGKNSIELSDILIGDVWIGSGQSNMEWSVAASAGARETIAAANCPTIRLLHVAKTRTASPAKDIIVAGAPAAKPGRPGAASGSWKNCTPATVRDFSAVLFYFGQCLQKDLDVPMGLINSSWGGSPIEAWIPASKNGGPMYNAMVAPLEPFAIRGAIWYQGESNIANGLQYYDKMNSLITGWRNAWGQDFPFYFVQIAPFSHYKHSLPELWEAQAASLKIPRTGMAVTTDLVDNVNDIHPKKKLEVGTRLALWARAKEYGKPATYSGPLYKSMTVEGRKVRIAFAHTDGGLKARDGKPLCEFEVAGGDGKFVAADATIDGNTVVVEAKSIAAPTQVRFAWRNTPNANLVNAQGLPASAFRTKDWHGGTGE